MKLLTFPKNAICCWGCLTLWFVFRILIFHFIIYLKKEKKKTKKRVKRKRSRFFLNFHFVWNFPFTLLHLHNNSIAKKTKEREKEINRQQSNQIKLNEIKSAKRLSHTTVIIHYTLFRYNLLHSRTALPNPLSLQQISNISNNNSLEWLNENIIRINNNSNSIYLIIRYINMQVATVVANNAPHHHHYDRRNHWHPWLIDAVNHNDAGQSSLWILQLPNNHTNMICHRSFHQMKRDSNIHTDYKVVECIVCL